MAYEKPSTDAYVIDGPAFVHKYKPTVSCIRRVQYTTD